MQHDVFISYANWDKKYADAACHYIEQEGVRCFIAPRDIRPGADWATSINAAIAEAKVFVLILTPNSNTSDQVLREVNLAVKNRLEIITFKVENVALDKGLEYYIGISHWLDALTKPLEKHLKTLADCVKEHCPPEKNQTPASGDALVKAKSGKEGIAAKRKLRPVVKLAIIVSTTVLVLLALFLSLRYHDKSADEVSMTTNSDAVAPTSSPESRKTDNSTGNIADMNPMFLFSKNVQTGDNFISKDLSVYADPQVDGSVLIRSTQERTILRTIQTPLTYDALRPENSKEDYDRVNTVFSDDHQWLVIYSFHYAHLFSMSDATIDRELPIQGILQGVQFIGNSAKIGLWYTDADGDYPVNYPPIDFSDRALVVDPQDNRALMSRELGESYQFLGFTKDGAYAAGEQGEDYITLVNLSGGETLRNNDALSVCNENVDFLPFSKDGKYVSLYQETLRGRSDRIKTQLSAGIRLQPLCRK